MNRRLLQFLQAENITQAQFADTLSVARGSVSHILAGRNKPGYDFLESLLLHYPRLNLDWLMTGKGKMYREDMAPEAPESASGELFPPIVQAPSAPQAVAIKPAPARKIEHITVFYTDNTFEEFVSKE
jgi:transcriptional regulator with XRE-family HTH domain